MGALQASKATARFRDRYLRDSISTAKAIGAADATGGWKLPLAFGCGRASMQNTMKLTLGTSPLDAKTRFHVQVKHAVAIGPDKADVLQAIAETGSIAEAGRRLGMSYQRVWSLVRAMNGDFIEPLVQTQCGGGGDCGRRGWAHDDGTAGLVGLPRHRARRRTRGGQTAATAVGLDPARRLTVATEGPRWWSPQVAKARRPVTESVRSAPRLQTDAKP
jgi:hypothetical protein